jgi:hypothetical protein
VGTTSKSTLQEAPVTITLIETPVTEIAPGMVIGGFAPGRRTVENLVGTQVVKAVCMEPGYDARGRYTGQRVTVVYFGDRGPSSFTGTDTVCVVEGAGVTR